MAIRLGGLKRRILAIIVVVITGVLVLVTLSVQEVLAEQLRVGVPRSLHAALVYVADSQGFFKKQGIDIVIKEYEAGALAVSDFLTDKLDVAAVGESVVVLQSFKHEDIRMLAAICGGSDVEFVVRKDRQIASPQDLRGRKVAVTKGSGAEFFLYNYLIFNNIPAESIHIIYQTPSEMVTAMTDGRIDAAISWPPYTTEMSKRLGAKATHWPGQSGQGYYQLLVAKEQFLKRTQPKVMEQFLAALSDAEGFVLKYPDRAQAILVNRLKVDRADLVAVWSLYRFPLQLTQDLLVLMEREAKWAMRNKMVEKKEMPNYLNFFYFDALDKVKAGGASIVH